MLPQVFKFFYSKVEADEVACLGESCCTLLTGRGTTRLIIREGTLPKEIYKAVVTSLLGGEGEGLVNKLEEAGWDLSLLALSNHGFTYTSND